MNIYLISQSVNNDYDTFDSAVVVAKSAVEARNINPQRSWGDHERLFVNWDDIGRWTSWCYKPSQVQVEYIGRASVKTKKPGVILASFNAG